MYLRCSSKAAHGSPSAHARGVQVEESLTEESLTEKSKPTATPRRRRCICCTWQVGLVSVSALLLLREACVRLVSREDASFVRSLQPIRRVRLSEVDFSDYHRKHVLSAVPLIVELPVAKEEVLWDRESLLRACANETVTLMSRATRSTLSQIRGTALEALFGLALRLLSTEGSLAALVRSRDEVVLGELARRIEAEREAGAEAASSASWLFSPNPRGFLWPVALLTAKTSHDLPRPSMTVLDLPLAGNAARSRKLCCF